MSNFSPLTITLVVLFIISLIALLRASSHVICDSPSLPVIEHTLRKNRSQLMRMPQIHCAQKYLSDSTIEELSKEIGLLE